MNFDRYTDNAVNIVRSAQNKALAFGHQSFSPTHILIALINDSDNLSLKILKQINADIEKIKKSIEISLSKIPVVENSNQLIMAKETAQIFEIAERLASDAKDSYVSVDRLLQAVSSISNELKENNISSEQIKNAIESIRGGNIVDHKDAEQSFDALTKYTKDVTESARKGKIDPVIGRDDEIRRIIQVLSRKTKNNPVLIGEPGVGKTAIIEGLAIRIIQNDIPENLKNCKLISLDLGALIAGTKFRGEFEERLKSVLRDVEKAQGTIILFIDELHTLIGAGSSEGGMDASNLLKPALARGELHCIGATTLDEYSKYIEKDAAFARRFQSLYVNEPNVIDTISILRGIKERYELHHGIRITDSAIIAAANLSNRYITNRFLPDKAIDLIDEASSRLRIEIDSKPEEIDELDRKLTQLKIEQSALKLEEDQASIERLNNISNEIQEIEKNLSDITIKWQAEKSKIDEIKNLKQQLDQFKYDLDVAGRTGNLAKAGELTYGIIPKIKEDIEKKETDIKEGNILREAVTEHDIALVISKMIGIPLDKMLGSEKEKLINIESVLSKEIIGQNEAISAIGNAVRRSRAGLQDSNRPLGSFLFLGPTGVGKTELSKALANFLFNNKNALHRIDMSEYMEKHSVARLIGAPPGYVGYEQGGSLTESVRQRPYQIILFDEVEKAHPDIFNIMLQILDEGILTDGQGRKVDFKNTIIILTSNLGAELIASLEPEQDIELVKDDVMDIVKSSFKPEFINRLDEIILFNKLQFNHIVNIIDMQIRYIMNMLKSRNINLNLDEESKSWLASISYDSIYGARPVRRTIQKYIQDPLSLMILNGKIKDNDQINITEKEGKLIYNIN